MNAPSLRIVEQREVPLIEVVMEDHDGYQVTADIPCPACLRGDLPPHTASPFCESGQRNHCTCDRCF